MKKAVAYIGSRAGERSHTYRYAKRILEAAAGMDPEIEWEIILPGDAEIAPCLSCNRCFHVGECPQREDIEAVAEKIRGADFVIFGSPVYVHNISSDMMRLIERLACWCKTLELAGKYGMAISTTSSNGHDTVISYLEHVLQHFGVYVAAKDNAAIHLPPEFLNEDVMREKADRFGALIVDCLNGRGPTEPDNIMNLIFKANQRVARSLEIMDSHIYRSWKDRGLFDFPDFAAFFTDRRKRGG